MINATRKQRPAILIFNATSPLATGGVKRFTEELVEGIGSSDFQSYALFGKNRGSFVKSLIELLVQYLGHLRKVDAVHFVTLSPYNLVFVILAKICTKKIIVTYHGLYFEEVSLTEKTYKFVSYWIADRITRLLADVIVSPSNYLLSRLNITRKYTTIDNPIKKITELSPTNKNSSDGLVLITASNFNIKKKSAALKLLLLALNKIVEDDKNVKLLVFGDGIELKDFRASYSANDEIVFMGFRKDFRSFLLNADAYIHISGLDNQPYSIIEAMMLGKTILFNDHEALREMLDKDNNYMVSMTPDSIAAGLRSLLYDFQESPELIVQKGLSNREFALKRFSSEIVTQKYIGIYSELVRGTCK